MAQIPGYDQWMKDTYSLTSPRSEFLKKLDEAVKLQNRDAIKTALDRWRFEQSKQGKDWRKSVRNEKGAVTNLERAVNDLDKRKLSEEEREALQYISRSQALALQKQFAGKQVKFKHNTLVGLANGAGTKWQKFKAGAGSLAGGAGSAKTVASNVSKLAVPGDTSSSIRNAVTSFCRELCPGLDPNHIFNALHLGSVSTFATELTPFVGIISSGGKAVIGWIGVAKRAWDRRGLAETRFAFAPGDPEAAFEAVIALLDREIKSEAGRATNRTVAFTGKALGAFADGGAVTGPVIGLLEILADIFQTIIEYIMDYKECEEANDLLRVGALNLEIFSVCPILGCYFIVVQDHSTIINFAVGDYGKPNWMLNVERLVKKIDPVLGKAREYIRLSRLEIPGGMSAKGVVEANYSHKTGLDKVSGAPGVIKDKIANRIDAWFDKPERPPKVDRSRIVGFGSG